MKAVLALICLAVYCGAQDPKTLSVPKALGGSYVQGYQPTVTSLDYFIFVLFKSDKTKNYKELAKISYDETNQRVRVTEVPDFGPERDYFDTLFLQSTKREYKLNMKTKECTVTDLTGPFRPFGVPPEAKFQFQVEVGASGVPGESLISQAFTGVFEDNSRFYTSVTYPDCIPLNYGYYYNDTGFILTDFFDITLGLQDPMVFIPPKECNNL